MRCRQDRTVRLCPHQHIVATYTARRCSCPRCLRSRYCPKIPSLSCTKNLGLSHLSVAWRICCLTEAKLGFVAAFMSTIRRDAISMTTKTCATAKDALYCVRKSQASILAPLRVIATNATNQRDVLVGDRWGTGLASASFNGDYG